MGRPNDEARKLARKKWLRRAAAEGRCIHCGKPVGNPLKVKCPGCVAWFREYQRARRARQVRLKAVAQGGG